MQAVGQSLNPFYFRAGLLRRIRREHRNQDGRLNPFYFRAGLLLFGLQKSAPKTVLIPFISGLDCYKPRHRLLEKLWRVLIPFISGLDCYTLMILNSYLANGS